MEAKDIITIKLRDRNCQFITEIPPQSPQHLFKEGIVFVLCHQLTGVLQSFISDFICPFCFGQPSLFVLTA